MSEQAKVRLLSAKVTRTEVSTQQENKPKCIPVPDLDVETNLTMLLEKMITYLEKFIKTKEEVDVIEEQLHDYDSLADLVLINKSIFEYLTEKIDVKLQKYKKELQIVSPEKAESLISEENFMNQNYDKLEVQTQKYEAEIRNHIKIEQQLKLYAESVQEKFENYQKQAEEESIQAGKKQEEQIKLSMQLKEDKLKIENELVQAKLEIQKLLDKMKSQEFGKEIEPNLQLKQEIFNQKQFPSRQLQQIQY